MRPSPSAAGPRPPRRQRPRVPPASPSAPRRPAAPRRRSRRTGPIGARVPRPRASGRPVGASSPRRRSGSPGQDRRPADPMPTTAPASSASPAPRLRPPGWASSRPASTKRACSPSRPGGRHGCGCPSAPPEGGALGLLRAEVDEASTCERRLAAEQDELHQLLAGLPDEITALKERESEARDAERDLPGVRDKVVSLRSRREAAEQAVRLADELTEAADLHRQAVDEAQQLRESWLQIQEQRIHGIAAELAGALVVGGQCPVCGSADHPRPASPDAGAPDAATEKAARKRVDDAEAARHAHDVRVRELTGRLETARSTADGDLAFLREELATAESELRRLTALADSAADRHAAPRHRGPAIRAHRTSREGLPGPGCHGHGAGAPAPGVRDDRARAGRTALRLRLRLPCRPGRRER